MPAGAKQDSHLPLGFGLQLLYEHIRREAANKQIKADAGEDYQPKGMYRPLMMTTQGSKHFAALTSRFCAFSRMILSRVLST